MAGLADASRALKAAQNVYKIGRSAASLASAGPSLAGLGSGLGAGLGLASMFVHDPDAQAGLALAGPSLGAGLGAASGTAAGLGALGAGVGGLAMAGASLAVNGQQAAEHRKNLLHDLATRQNIADYQGVPSANFNGLVSNLGALMSGAPNNALSQTGPAGLSGLVAYGNMAKIPTYQGSGDYMGQGLLAEDNIRKAALNNTGNWEVPRSMIADPATWQASHIRPLKDDLAILQNDPNKIAVAASGDYPNMVAPTMVPTSVGGMTPEVAKTMGYQPKDYVESLKWGAAQAMNDAASRDAAFTHSAPGTAIPQNIPVNPNLWDYVQYAQQAPAALPTRTYQAPGAGAVDTSNVAPPTTAPAQEFAAYKTLAGLGINPAMARQMAGAGSYTRGTIPAFPSYGSAGNSPDARLASGGDVDDIGGIDALVSLGNDDTDATDPGYLDRITDMTPTERAALFMHAMKLSPGALASVGLARGGLVGPGSRGGPGARGPELMKLHRGSGLIRGETLGRADAITADLPRGGYVMPADVVSSLGEGNTAAGARGLRSMISRSTPGFARGGRVPTAKVNVSAGEFYIHPHHVAALGGGDLNRGSAMLDGIVKKQRGKMAKNAKRLPPPR